MEHCENPTEYRGDFSSEVRKRSWAYRTMLLLSEHGGNLPLADLVNHCRQPEPIVRHSLAILGKPVVVLNDDGRVTLTPFGKRQSQRFKQNQELVTELMAVPLK